MNHTYAVILQPARTALTGFALSVALAVLVIAGLAGYRSGKAQSIRQLQGQLAQTREYIGKLTVDLDTVNKLATKYKALTRQGFIGEPDRDGWAQRLETLYRDTRLPATLRYTLAPPKRFNPQALPASENLSYRNNVLYHDMALELSGIHEGELLDFMDKLKSDWKTPYRVEACQITREAADVPITGLQIKCTLQLYSLPAK